MNSIAKPLTVSVIGSCRVQNPILWLRNNKKFLLNCGNTIVYAHQTGDIFQQLLIREGLLTLPMPQSVFAFDQPVLEAKQKTFLNPAPPSTTDVAVIEISTIKAYVFDGIYSQHNHCIRHIGNFFKNPEDFQLWREEVEREDRNQVLIDSLLPKKMPLAQREAARYFRIIMQTPESLIEEMKKIATILKLPILWVSHNRLTLPNGNRIQQRDILVKTMRKGCAELGHSFFEPTEYIENYGQEKAIKAENKNFAEYTPEFIPVLATVLLYHINEVWEQSKNKGNAAVQSGGLTLA